MSVFFSSTVFADCDNFSAQKIVHIKRLQCGTCRSLQDDKAGQVQGAQDHLPRDQHQVSRNRMFNFLSEDMFLTIQFFPILNNVQDHLPRDQHQVIRNRMFNFLGEDML